MRRIAATFVLTLLGATAASAQPTLRIPRVSEAPRIEDFLDGTPPPGAVSVTEFVQREPGDGTPASQQTTAYVSYDDEHLYVVFVCRDQDPQQIRARLTRREDIIGDDVVGLLLDTFHDRRRSYLFLVNPLGIQLDGVVSEGQDDDFSFDTLWRSHGRLTPFGFVVHIAVPFKSLRFTSEERQTWGIALARIIPRSNETVFWPYITRRVAGFGQQLATLDGLERISAGRNIQLIPYSALTGARIEDRPSAGGYTTDVEPRVGLDAKVVLKDAFTLDLALNPDFSQVESDEPQVTVNQRFEVFFPERRPFFIENATYFETPIQLVFSRRIADPQFGARLTGKARGWALGALAIDDRAPGRRVAPGEPGFGDRTGVGILRAQRDIGEQSAVGVLVTSRDFGSASSRVAGVDGRVKLNDNWVAGGQGVFSHTAHDGTEQSGGALAAFLNRQSRGFQYSAEYRDISPHFRAPLGFVRRTNIRRFEQRADYSWHRTGKRIQRYGPEFRTEAIWDHAGKLQDWSVEPGFDIELHGQTFVSVEHEQSYELFEGIGFRKRSTSIFAHTSWLRWLDGFGFFSQGTAINLSPAAGRAPFLGSQRSARIGLTFRAGPRLRIEQSYLYNALSTRRGGASIFTNHILRSRVNYQFTRTLSVRAILDYAALLPDSSLVDLTEEERVTGDLLFTWLLNPGTAVYVGYTDRYEGSDPFDVRFDRSRSSLRSVGRQVFVKASYLLRF